MKESGEILSRSLTLKYAVALAFLAMLAIVNFFILRSTILEHARLATVVNQAGHQRMLLYRTSINAERYFFAFDETLRAQLRNILLSDAESLEGIHQDLKSHEARRIGVAEDVRAIYEKAPWMLDSEMRKYLGHVRSLANSNSDELNISNADFAHIRNSEVFEKILTGLEAIADVYETSSSNKSNQLVFLAIWSVASSLILLIIDAYFVFRPMVLQVRKDVVDLNDLNETLEQRVAERTAEAELRAEQLGESEALYSSLVHHIPMSVIRKDVNGKFTFANENFCQMVGKELPDIIGRADVDFYPKRLAIKYREDDLEIMKTRSVFQGIEQHQTPDGKELFVEVLKVPLCNADTEVFGIQIMFWDVTDRKQAEQRALQAERLAAIGQMVTGVAHESRNALQQIQACSQLLKWELDGDDKKLLLIADLQKAEERLLRTFEELRGYAATIKLDLKSCDVRDVVVASWSATELQRARRDVCFSENTRGVRINCLIDPFQLEQVFRNIFENSLAACEDPVRIEIEYEEVTTDDRVPAMQITVRDNGPGLSPEQQARIFEPFFTTKTEGTGLGMAIVKRIVDAHNGQIVADANATKGTAMIVTLPSGESPPNTTEVKLNDRK